MGQRSANIDLFRFFGACAVVLIHSIYADELPLLTSLGRWAVPFFFSVSGYFFYKSYSKNFFEAFGRTFKSILSILVVANLFYLFFLLATEGSVAPVATHYTLLVGTHFHLWFLTSLLLGYLILCGFLWRHWQAALPYVIAFFVVLIWLLDPYSFLLRMEPHPLYARLLLSIPFLCIGFLTAKYSLDQYVPKRRCWLLIGVGIGWQLLEIWVLSKDVPGFLVIDFLMGTLFLSVGIFLLALQITVSPTNKLSYYGQRYSLLIYLYHPVANYYLNKLPIISLSTKFFYWISPIATLIITLVGSILLDKCTPFFGILSGDFGRVDARGINK